MWTGFSKLLILPVICVINFAFIPLQVFVFDHASHTHTPHSLWYFVFSKHIYIYSSILGLFNVMSLNPEMVQL